MGMKSSVRRDRKFNFGEFEIQTIQLTLAAANEAVTKVLTHSEWNFESAEDIAKRVLIALGFKQI